jgi:hypothetical protein
MDMPSNVKLVIGMIAATFVVSLAIALWPTKQPFDEWYDEAMPEHADWKLVVDYSVAGLKESQRFEACYRRREDLRFRESSWALGDEPTVWVESYEGGINHLFYACYACGQNGGCSENTMIQPESTPQGVRLSMDLERRGGKKPFQANATIDIPFRTEVSGNSGRLAYKASWVRVTGGE